ISRTEGRLSKLTYDVEPAAGGGELEACSIVIPRNRGIPRRSRLLMEGDGYCAKRFARGFFTFGSE
ncbi:MAG TPA: hypothetical protein VFL82_15180, partial [Thermomicrobiales bacterium]|nr:hypothetical protein [Thermomicrobiales bacterium]